MTEDQDNLWLPLDEVKSQAAFIFSKIAQSGASADLILEHTRTHAFKAKQGVLEENKATDLVNFGVRVIKDQRVGLAYSQARDSQALTDMVEQALVNASFSGVEAYETINGTINETNVAHINPDNQAVPEENLPNNLPDTLFTLEQQLLDRQSIISVPYNGLVQTYYETLVLNSRGSCAHHRSRNYALYAYALAEHGQGEQKKNAMAGKMCAARSFNEMCADALAKEIADQTLDFLEGVPVSTGRWDVIFSTDALAQVLGVFTSVLSGKGAKDGINPWRDQLNQTVADERLSVSDQPLKLEGLGFSPFDSEGMPTQATQLIEQGQLRSLLHNQATAAYFNTANTAHARRSPKSALDVGVHQLFVHPGSQADASNLTTGSYLKLTDLTGLHSGANPISGEFSFGASGYWIDSGKARQVVRQITVAGNFFQLLKQIRWIGETVEFNSAKTYCLPQIRFKDLSITGV